MKKRTLIIAIASALMGMLFLAACSSQSEETKYYDTDFVTSLEKGLVDRWSYTDNKNNSDDFNSKKGYTIAIQKELDQIKKYQDLKFKNSKLKEAALSYINELKNGQSVAKTYGAKSFDENWSKHYDSRTAKLNTINNIKKIKMNSENQSNLDELLASGKDVSQKNKNEEKIKEFVKTIIFTKDENNSNDYFSKYVATVENKTGLNIKSLSLVVKLIDNQGTTVDTKYVTVDNLANNEKRQLEFSTDKEFSKIQIISDKYYEIEE